MVTTLGVAVADVDRAQEGVHTEEETAGNQGGVPANIAGMSCPT
jgi:hypothetical protein